MNNQFIFNFKTDISRVNTPEELNNPFGTDIPEIVRIATKEFQEFITSESPNWTYDFRSRQGKMFGVLVIQKAASDYAYIGTVSGRLSRERVCDNFVPSVFDDSVDDFFMDRGMTELTEICNTIDETTDKTEISVLKAARKQKSIALQKQLFDNYQFLNTHNVEKSLLQIFEDSTDGNPPSAAGECAAPKLLQYAFAHQLRPIALAEFWWGNPLRNKERKHKSFYPACKDRCKPLLEYMLNDSELFNRANPGLTASEE